MKNILMVEDDMDFAEMVQARLETGGYRVHHAADAYQGNKLISNNTFDLIILDLRIPVGGGFGLLQHIREDPVNKNMPVIVLTGQTVDSDIIGRSEKLHVDAIFTKPYNPARFMDKVHSLLSE